MTLVATTFTNYYTLTNLTEGKEYIVTVEPVGADGSVGNISSAYIETIPATVKNFRQERWYYFIHILDVAWDRIDTADKITVTLYNSKGKKVGKSQELSGSSTSTSFSNMKDEVYTVKIQASKTVNGKTYTTAVSSIQCFNQARITSAKVSKKKLTVRWGKIGGATGYDIYVSTKPTTGYKKVKSVGKNVTKVTIPKLKGKAFSSKKTYYVYVETKKKNGKKVSKSGRLYYWNTKNTGYGYF
jgi:outer membrane protein assembly factor BamE (lipoprotein component of BamABCDE complex)